MTRRYFAPELPTGGGHVTLSSEESQHAIRVMRVAVGDRVTLFDGDGSEAFAEVFELGRNQCHVRADPPQSVNREPRCQIHLAIAFPKPDRARELIERLTELGVHTVTPLVANRTQRPPSDSLLDKLRRGVIEASKQCERNQRMEIRSPTAATEFFTEPSDGARWIAHACDDATPIADVIRPDHVTAAVGPEGGWTEEEVAAATGNGFLPIHLGKRIYRIETAATVIAALLSD